MLALACGDDGDAEAASETPSPQSQDTTTTTVTPEAEVEAAYLAYWDMLDRLSQAPDPNDPEIAQHVSGEALLEVIDGLRTLRAQGHVAQIGPQYAHSVLTVEVRGNRAVVRDCVVDDSTIVNEATGQVIEGGEAATGVLEVTMLVRDSRWQVDSVDRVSTEPGVTACER